MSWQGEEEEWVRVSATQVPKEEMHVIDWLEAQNEDPIIQGAIEWMQLGKEKSLKHHLGALASTSEGLGFISRQKSLVLVNGKLYLKCKLKGEAKTPLSPLSLRPTGEKQSMVVIEMWVIRAKIEPPLYC